MADLNVDDLLGNNDEPKPTEPPPLNSVVGATPSTPIVTVSTEPPPLPVSGSEVASTSVADTTVVTTEPAEVDEILATLLSRITPVAEATPYRKMLWYGPPGSWKTVTACTAPRPLLVAVEPNGPVSLHNHPDIMAKTQVYPFKSFRALEVLIEKMTEKPDAFPFDTVIIDTINELQKYDLDVFIAQAHAADNARSEFKATWDEYGASTEHMRRFVSALERLPKNVILLCHTRQTEDKTRGILLEGPDLTQKLAGTIVGKMDLVGYMSVTNDGTNFSSAMQVHPSQRIVAKTRIGGHGMTITNPTWDSIVNAVRTNSSSSPIPAASAATS